MSTWHEILWIDLSNGKYLPGELRDTAIRDDGSISIDCTYAGIFYTLALRPSIGTPMVLEGEFRSGKSGRSPVGRLTAVRYDSECALLLRGTWIEDGCDYLWMARLAWNARGRANVDARSGRRSAVHL